MSTRKEWKAGLGDGKWSVDHESAKSFGHAPIVEGSKVVAIAVTTGHNDDDALIRDRIIRAVNNHDPLVSLLMEIRKWMDKDELGPWDAKFVADIDAAIARAGAP